MNEQQINTYLKDTQSLYAKRKLSEASVQAKDVLELAKKNSHRSIEIQAHLNLARIYNTTNKYEGKNLHREDALQHLVTAQGLSELGSNISIDTEILLEMGKLYENDAKPELALQYFGEALQLSEQNDYSRGIVLSKIALCEHYMLSSNLNTALVYANQCVDILEDKSIPDNELLSADVYNFLGRIYIKKQDYVKSLKFSSSVLDISRKYQDVEKELTALNNLAILYGIKSDYKMAMEHLLDALDRSSSINYRGQVARCLINIGNVYANLFNYDSALEKYHKILKEYNDVIDDTSRISLYNNIGNLYYSLVQNEKAEMHFKKGLELATECNHRPLMAQTQAQLGRVHTAMGRFKIAKEQAELAQDMFDELGDVNGHQLNLINLGDIHFNLGNYNEAIKLVSQGIVYAKMLNDGDNEIRAYLILANIHRDRKDFEQAYRFQSIYTAFREEYSKVKRNRQILDMEIKYTIQEKQKEIEQLSKEVKLQGLLLKQRDKIVKQNEQLTEANEELKQFAYVTSHDLKEPMRMIGSYSQLINRSLEEHIDGHVKEYFEFVGEGVTRMNQLLDDLLRYATIGNSVDDFEEVDLKDVVEISKMNLKVLIEEVDATVEYSSLPKVTSIHSLVNQLFQNLIGNAIKFRKPDVNPIIKISSIVTEDSYVINIKDNGIGIAKEHQDRIFVIFQRLHSRKAYKGTGIGLSICQKIMNRLGGSIQVASEEGQGSTFSLIFPKSIEIPEEFLLDEIKDHSSKTVVG